MNRVIKFVLFEKLAQLTKFINKILTRQAQIKPKKKKNKTSPDLPYQTFIFITKFKIKF